MGLHEKISAFILKILHNKKTHKFEVNGKKFIIDPNVFRADISVISTFVAENIKSKKNDLVLDLGCGTGILSIFAADKAKKVIAVDINPAAIKCTKENIKLNKVKNIEVRKGDLFAPVKNIKFDLILFNPPYIHGKPRSMIERAWLEGGLMKRFFKDVKNHLKRNGRILMGYSSIASSGYLEHLAKGFKIKKIAEKRKFFEDFYIFELTR